MPENETNEKKFFSKKPIAKPNKPEKLVSAFLDPVVHDLLYKGKIHVCVVLWKISGFVVSLVSAVAKFLESKVKLGVPKLKNHRKRNPVFGNFFRKSLQVLDMPEKKNQFL